MSSELSSPLFVLVRSSARVCLYRTVVFLLVAAAGTAWTADQAFVGVLALAVEDQVAKQLGLSDKIQNELLDLVDQREADALNLALKIRSLPEEERSKRLEPFRKESEQMGLALLSSQQQAILEGIRIARVGPSALQDTSVASRLRLSPEQRSEVARLLGEQSAASEGLGGNDVVEVRNNYERQLRAVLDAKQTAAWQDLTQQNTKRSNETVEADLPKRSQSMEASGQLESETKTNGKLRFSFRYARWADVIEWFASESGLSLIMDAPPQGTLNYSDPRDYSPAQAIDLLNSVLLTKGYTLVRRDNMLIVVNLEDGIPPNLITEVSVEELNNRGEYELTKCLFSLEGVRAEDAAEEIGRLIGPQGKVNVLASSNQLQITETAGRLRTFRKILEAGERKGDSTLGTATLIQLQHVRANDILSAWRQLMGLAEDENVSADGSMRLAKGKASRQLLVSGEAYRIDDVQELVKLLDIPSSGGSVLDTPQLEVYPVTEADPESVLSVLQELFADADEIRLTTDPESGSVVALATPDEHATIRATIEQLQADRRQVEVVRLRTVDPQLAMLSIEKLFGLGVGGDEAKPNPNAPRVDADPVSRSLLIRASEAQIDDIRSLLVKMGEQDASGETNGRSSSGDRGNLRMIPVDAATARRVMEQMNSIWPTVRRNQIRTVRPSKTIRSLRDPAESALEKTDAELQPNAVPSIESDRKTKLDSEFNSTSRLLESLYVADETKIADFVSDTDKDGSFENDLVKGDSGAHRSRDTKLPDIIVTMGEQGLLAASEDTEALNEFEDLFATLSDRLFAGTREMAIFYLKHAKADVASEMLQQFISGSSSSSSGGGGSTLLGSLAGAALGNSGIGSMLGLGGGGGSASARISSGTTIVTDARLNAVIVQATPKELDFIQELLSLLDKSKSPERIETIPRPRAIPILHTDASAVADIVRSVYATRLAGSNGQQAKPPSPEEFIRAISGQKNTKQTIDNSIQDQIRVNISIDARRNALLVVAPDSLFQEIRELVEQLDFAAPDAKETIRYGRATGSSPEMIRSAIATITDKLGEQGLGEVTEAKQSSKRDDNNAVNDKSKSGSNESEANDFRRRMEFLKALQNRAAKQRAATEKKAVGKK